jgi:hypothetical protein
MLWPILVIAAGLLVALAIEITQSTAVPRERARIYD